ncbi:MAG TPA: hypothetical protein VGF94_17595 [Kofleriaceae bacterium]
MYRDASIALDEHDRAVGAILIGEALREECDRAWVRSRDLETTSPRQRWRAIVEIHDLVPEIWRHLDRARKVLATRGANTAGYDELRPNAQPTASNPGLDGERAIDEAAIDDAKRGLAELKLAAPGADWAAIEARTQGLVRIPFRRKHRQRLSFAGGAAAIAFAASAWLFAIAPAHGEVIKHANMASELRLVTEQRKLQIDVLIANVGERCTPAGAHELMRLLVLDGRNEDARTFAAGYIAHCGEDPVVVHWAKAPHPKH